MKKIFAVFLMLTVILTLICGCSSENNSSSKSEITAVKTEVNTTQPADEKKNDNTSDAKSGAQTSNPKISVSVPDGWTKMESVALAQYMKETASFIVTSSVVSSETKGRDDYVEFAKNQFKKTFSDVSFSDAKKITVNGMEGRDFEFSATVSGLKMKYRVVYLFKDSQVYTLTCGAFGDDFDKMAAEYQSIIESFKVL